MVGSRIRILPQEFTAEEIDKYALTWTLIM